MHRVAFDCSRQRKLLLHFSTGTQLSGQHSNPAGLCKKSARLVGPYRAWAWLGGYTGWLRVGPVCAMHA